MTQFRFYIAFLLTFVCVPTLHAFLHPGSCEWVFHAQFLYLKPSVDDTYFVINGASPTGDPFGPRINNDFHFHPAFRVGGGFGLDCDREIQFHYTRLQEKRNKSISGTNLFSTDSFPPFALSNYTGTAESHLDLLYQQFAFLLGQQILPCNDLRLYVQAGLEVASFRLRTKNMYNEPGESVFLTVRRLNKTWFIGPKLGFDGDYDLCSLPYFKGSKLMITGALHASLLASKPKHEDERDVVAVGARLIRYANFDQTSWRVVPLLQACLGLKYLVYCSRFKSALEVGYEFTSYIRGLAKSISKSGNSADGSSMTNFYNFNLQGLYVALDVGF